MSYLPLTALGIPVDFQPSSPGDASYAGLTGLQPRRREARGDAVSASGI